MKQSIFGVIRHLLTIGAGYLVGKGYLDETGTMELVGLLMSVLAIGWSIAEKRGKAPLTNSNTETNNEKPDNNLGNNP
jgi:hypothetical protein